MRRTFFRARYYRPLATFALAILVLVVYMNRRKIGIILSNTFEDRPHPNRDNVQEELRRLQPLKVVEEEGDLLGGAKTCKRAWQRGASPWFDKRYNETIPPLWTGRNRELTKEVRDWWLSIHEDGNRDIPALLKSLFKLIPEADPYPRRNLERCVRCAVVGNSGNLRNSKYGKLIDSHHRIIRVNYAPIKGYEEDVGTRETHRLAYPVTYTEVQKGAHFVLVPFGAKDIDWLISALTNGTIKWTYSPVPRFIEAERSKIQIYNPALMFQGKFSWIGSEERWPSTGFLMILFAFHICDEVNIFGFGASSYGAWDHYWEPDAGPWNLIYKFFLSPHKHSVEETILEKWNEEGKVKIHRGVR
ncbi:CMP-N-acetylneuraminate-beta-galactosamide-alpha-2,3-sialyltransferase 1-like isoform X2 [Patiria miniata]|uniref:CMP-N-acetylneuraminate-beta-galactosamide-alpha-2,3-sialyltransferase 2 n=1 Tax=Patiria miniata TaxID=46514 RepID=A0A913ZLW6_PATMI|nr:CMP-N-acetylneuraminate-beta-galactosamide-alpha-2,3-sialyltransferase 1-like isoform X2 [Patiria miniata]